MALDMR